MASELEGKFIGVTAIDVSKEDLNSLREFMKSPKASVWVKDNRMKKLVGSWCAVCDDIPTKIATYDVEDVNGREELPDEVKGRWHNYKQCDGCKRWWSSLDLLIYHKKQSNNACAIPNIK